MSKESGDVPPMAPLLNSKDLIQDPIRHWLDVEYFEADPAQHGPTVFERHALLVSFNEHPADVIYEREGRRHNLTLTSDTFVILPAQTSHGIRWDTHLDMAVIWIDPDTMRNFVELEIGIPDLGPTLDSEITITDSELATTARQICEALRRESLGSGIVFDALARVFLATLVRKYSRRPQISQIDRKQIDGTRYRLLVEYVRENIDRPIRVDDLAQLAGMSRSHFSRAFKSATSRSPMSFVTFVRIEEAATLLLQSEIQIGQIALRCGFADQAHLTRTFKRERGISPSKFRRQTS